MHPNFRHAVHAAVVALLLSASGCAGCEDQSGLSPPTPPVAKFDGLRRRSKNWRPTALGPFSRLQKRDAGAVGADAQVDGGTDAAETR
jgi:hypothetical protein